MVKKIIALFVSSIFAFGLGIAYAQEETVLNPWERDQQRTASQEKENKIKKKDRKMAQKSKKTNKKKAGKTDVAKADKKEAVQKKKYIFW